ncbi:MAG: hypothetical protein J3Q66DRAFT_384571 [Benniella sp.]|nr:MAG: hypothetical protein J3Q66DRAFT_384571 [Benniella sp.]
MKLFAAIVTLILATLIAAQQPVFTNCAASTAEFTVASFSIFPHPACVSQNVCVTITGMLSAPITAGAKVTIVGRYLGRVVYTDNQDLCALSAAQGNPCPLPVSLTSLTVCVLVKTNAPVGIPVTISISATNGNGNPLFCQSATVQFQNCPI